MFPFIAFDALGQSGVGFSSGGPIGLFERIKLRRRSGLEISSSFSSDDWLQQNGVATESVSSVVV